MTSSPPTRRAGALHVFALANVAFAQPLFAVLGQNGEFFVASRSGPRDVLLLAAALVVGLPAALVLVETAAGLLGNRVRRGVHLTMIAVLMAAIALPLLGRPWSTHGQLVVLLAAIAGGAGAVVYRRVMAAQVMISLLSVVSLLAPLNFLLNSDATKILFAARAAPAVAVAIASHTPVVLVIFDELPLASLLDEQLQFDAARYPNFARLASTSRWFRNATSVSDGTLHAVPAILTGRTPRKGLLPTASDQPDSLFTLVGGSYRIHAHEPVTSLCPERLCPAEAGAETGGGVRMLLTDAAVVLGHTLLPRDLAARALPSIDQRWHGFLRARGQPTAARAQRPAPADDGSSELTLRVARDRRSLYVLHAMLPHVPWRFLPGGHTYGRSEDIPGLGLNEQWTSDAAAIVDAYQRHLLQVGYVDRVLGRLIGELQAAGMFDEALVIVTADHGCSFHAADSRRHLTHTNWSDVLRVPLLVKLPAQHRGSVIDAPVQTVDIVPTIADVLDVKLPFAVDGRSLLREDGQAAARRVAVNDAFTPFSPAADLSGLQETVSRKAELFGTGADTRKLFARGPYWQLVGMSLDRLRISPADGLTSVVNEPEAHDAVDPGARPLPALISGTVSGAALGPDTAAAVAVNGIVRAVARLTRYGQGARFETVLPDASFVAGKNDVEILVVNGASAGPRLTRTRRAQAEYTLAAVGGTERLVAVSGRSVVLQPGVVNGFVDIVSRTDMDGYFSIYGWVADHAHAGLPAVLVFADGQLVASAGPTGDRPDIARTFGDDSLLRSGYVVRVPLRDLAKAQSVRVVGLSPTGVASELQYTADFPYLPEMRYRLSSGSPQQLVDPERRTIPVERGAVRGDIDSWSEADGRFSLFGWAADPAHPEPPAVVVFADGRPVAIVRPTLLRLDVARTFKRDKAVLAGYVVHFTLPAVEGARRLRVFGISPRGIASELSYPDNFPRDHASTGTR